jgi:hypothetical protein
MMMIQRGNGANFPCEPLTVTSFRELNIGFVPLAKISLDVTMLSRYYIVT